MNNIIIYLLFSTMLFSIIFSGEENNKKGKLAGKTILMIIAKSDFRDEELLEPKSIFEKEKAKVVIASTTLSEVTGMLGAKVKPDTLLKDVKVEDFDAVIFVGGIGAKQYFNDKTAHKIAIDAYEKNKLVCAICIAPNILANAGLLKNKKSTCWQGGGNPINLKRSGSNYTGKSVEKDGRIITGNGPAAAKEFANVIINTLITR